MITTMFFILVPFLKRAPCIIIHLARNAEKGGGVLMSIILPNLNHSFVPDSGSGSRFRIPVPFPDSGFPGFPFARRLWGYDRRPKGDVGKRSFSNEARSAERKRETESSAACVLGIIFQQTRNKIP